MKNRAAFNLKPFILAYNVFLVVLHIGLFPIGLWVIRKIILFLNYLFFFLNKSLFLSKGF